MDKALAIQKQVIDILGTDEVYLVGGSVRDIVMGNTPKDYDFCTPMLPEDMIEKVKAAGRRVYTIGEQFGTIGFKVIYKSKEIEEGYARFEEGSDTPYERYEYVEVTTFRSEVYTNKNRKPEVKFVPSLEEDLARRDFTMNAMVLRPDGSIYDPYGGRIDILKRLINTVGLPKDRIQEDPLRMLRAARFAARYGFNIDPNFIGKARQIADRIYDVSIERWVQEIDKLLVSDNVSYGIGAMYDMRLWERIMPELSSYDRPDDEEPVEFKFENADQAWKALLVDLSGNPKTSKYMATGVCHRLKFSNNRSQIILS